MKSHSNVDSTDFYHIQQLMLQGEFKEALPLLQQFTSLHPKHSKSLKLLGHCQLELNQAEDALLHLHSALMIDPKDTHTLNLIGKSLVQLKKHVEAADVFRHAISIDKNCADSKNNLGMVLLELSRPHEALPYFLKAIELNPSHIKACVNLINILINDKNYEKAHKIIERIDTHNHKNEDFLSVCSDLYFHAKQFERCEYYANELVTLFPSQANYYKLNRCLLHQHKHDAFVKNTLEISQLYPDNSSNIIHAVTVLLDNGQIADSRALLNQQKERDPNGIELNIARAYDALRQLDFSSGWEAYEHRLRLTAGQIHFNQQPTWDGSCLKNANALVLAEQGMGDVILYSRFLINLLRDAKRVYLLCDTRLRCILESSFPHVICLSDATLLPHLNYDVSIALASLAKLYAKNSDYIKQRSPYINISQTIKHTWEDTLQRYIPSAMPRIAISLNAGIDDYNRLKRTCPFSSFLDIFPSKSITMIDIDHYREDTYKNRQLLAQEKGIELIAFDHITSNLDHLCGLISQLDLVITTQQTNAHICGALGIPCIVMLPQGAHFIYGENGDSTPWYPSLHLIRLAGWHKWGGLKQALFKRLTYLFPDFFSRCEDKANHATPVCYDALLGNPKFGSEHRI